jgi:integrase
MTSISGTPFLIEGTWTAPANAEGFLDYVGSLPPGPLFPSVPIDKYGRLNSKVSAIVMRWLRHEVGITDPHKRSHSWRHTFKTIGRQVGIEEQYADAVCGDANGSIDRGYGFYSIATLVREVERLSAPSVATGKFVD